MSKSRARYLVASALMVAFGTAAASERDPRDVELEALRTALAAEREQVEQQQLALEAQHLRLQQLEDRLLGDMRGAGRTAVATEQSQPAPTGQQNSEVEQVGEAPVEPPQAPEVAVLADQGGVITRKGRLTMESTLEYSRADRNRVIFRGIEVPQSVLVGVFDINESRQDVLTAALASRFGVTNRFELNARVPYIHRSDASVLAPVSATPESMTGTRDYSVDADGLGDIDFGMRYQLTDGRNGQPFLIAGLQVLAPTGTNPFDVGRDEIGNATRAATGSGFWGVSPNLTALLPTDPAVLFATLGYTHNFGRHIDRFVGDTFIERVEPGGEPSFSVGVGLSLNDRTSVSFGYAQTWSFGTETRVRVQDSSQTNPVLSDPITSTTRDLQLARYMFGVSYRINEKTTINWNLEVGATDDAADVRTTFRIPFGFEL